MKTALLRILNSLYNNNDKNRKEWWGRELVGEGYVRNQWKYVTKNPFGIDERIIKCFTCSSKEHSVRDCPENYNKNEKMRKLKWIKWSNKVTLYEETKLKNSNMET